MGRLRDALWFAAEMADPDAQGEHERRTNVHLRLRVEAPGIEPYEVDVDSSQAASVLLYLLRHAKSSWDDPNLGDHDRPLAKRGRNAAKLIAGHIREEGIAPDIVLCSSSLRTRETLERIERALPRGIATEIEDELYGATAEHLVERLRELPDDVESALLIGHNPALQVLALDLAAGGADLELLRAKFPTAALATLEIPGGGWAELKPAVAELVAYVRPRDLGPR